MNIELLKQVYNICEAAGLNVEMEAEHLAISLAADDNDSKEFRLLVSVIDSEKHQDVLPAVKGYALVSMAYPFPYQAFEERAQDVIKMVNLIDKVIILGAFSYNEEKKQCFYRHVHVLSQEQPKFTELLKEILLIQDILNLYVSAIEDVSIGAASLADFNP